MQHDLHSPEEQYFGASLRLSQNGSQRTAQMSTCGVLVQTVVVSRTGVQLRGSGPDRTSGGLGW